MRVVDLYVGINCIQIIFLKVYDIFYERNNIGKYLHYVKSNKRN